MAKHKRQNQRKKRRTPMKPEDVWFVTFSGDRDDDEGPQICITNATTTKLRNAAMRLDSGWCIMMAFICETETGYYSKQDQIIEPNCRIRSLDDRFKIHRELLSDDCNPNHIIDFGWIIRPYTKGRADKIKSGEYKTVLEYWLERKQALDLKTMQSLQAINTITREDINHAT